METNQKKLAYKVCILTAGLGSRAGAITAVINKGVLPVNNKAVISYIIEKFPSDTEIVIAVGHKKDTVVDYLALAHPERKFIFVEVDNYNGPGSGPGYSLLACRNHLQCPFIFCTSDTLVVENIPVPDHNWIGAAPVSDVENYCTLHITDGQVDRLDDKIKTDNKFAFIGLAGIHDHQEFFNTLTNNQELRNNERQMVDGFKGLIDRNLSPVEFTWFDTGTEALIRIADAHFSGGRQAFDFSKSDELLYFVGNRVIKFFADAVIAKQRYERAQNSLQGLTPVLCGLRSNFYAYEMIPGKTMYQILDTKIVKNFLGWAETNLWKRRYLSARDQEAFDTACFTFYKTKTEKRIELFFEKTKIVEPETVNGVVIPSVKELLQQIDWSAITKGIPSNFHGDLQFDNVIVAEEEVRPFALIDWRHDFGGLTSVGDLYYDLAKLYGGMIVAYPLVKKNQFSCELAGGNLAYTFQTMENMTEVREEYERYLVEKGFDVEKVKMLTALIFLNMSPLHHAPFDIMLYGLGRTLLFKSLGL